jgi:hypothetical protein
MGSASTQNRPTHPGFARFAGRDHLDKSEETVDSLPGEIGRGEIHYEILCHGDGTVP